MLQVEHLSKSYRIGNQVYPVLKDISIEVEKGEFVAVMGPSGSGKTTLLNCISRFIPYDEGAVLMGGEDISRLKEDELAKVRNRKMGFVFQDFMLLDGLTVFENICLPQIIDERPATGNLDSKSCRAVIDAFLKARDTMQATVFMVTHDSFAASFCDRVIILKDGQVSGIRENRGDRKAFMDELLDTIRVLGGDFDDNE